MPELGKLFEDMLSLVSKPVEATKTAAKPASKIPNPLGIATTMPPTSAGGELTAARQAGPLNLQPAPPRRPTGERSPDMGYVDKPQPQGGELTAAREQARAGRQQPVPRSVQRAQAEAVQPVAPPERVVEGTSAAERDPVKRLFADIEKTPSAKWRAMPGGRIAADTAKGHFNIYNLDQRRGKPVEYLRAIEDEAQSRGLASVRVVGPAAARLEDTLKNSNYTQEGKAWVKKLSVAGAAAGGAAVAGSDQADAADLKAIAKMFDTLEKSGTRKFFETPEGRILADVLDVPEEGGRFFNVTAAMTAPKKRGSGEFINNFFAIEQEAKKRGYAGIKAELVINPKLSQMLQRYGFTKDANAEFGAPLNTMAGEIGNYTKKFGVAGAAGAGATMLTGEDASAQGGFEVELPNGKTVTFPPGTTMDQVKEAVDLYKEETKTGWGRTKELFTKGVEDLRRGGEQLTGELPKEDIPDLMKRIAGIPAGQEKTDPERYARNKASYQKLAGAGNIASGIWDLITAPIGMVSQPLSHVDVPTGTGEKLNIPPKVTEGVLGLFSPVGAYKAGKTAVTSVPWSALPAGARSSITSIAAKMPNLGLGANADKDLAKAIIREKGGQAARETATTLENLEQYRRQVNAMPDHERFDLYRYMEARSTGHAITDPSTQKLADQVKIEFQKRMTELQGMTSTQKMSFIEDYFPHMWNDPTKVNQAMRNAAKQGSGANLKARTIPTISDGLAQGLTLKTTDPIEATMAYVANMDRFIAANKVVEEARTLGKVKYYMPGNRHIPQDWVPLDGRLATKATKVPGVIYRAYAPKEFATIYNNFISKGFYQWERPGQIYEAALKTSNAVTALELGLSGFHAVTMANEANLSSLANGIRSIVKGAKNLNPRQVLGGVKDVAKTPVAFVTSARRGSELKNVYLGQTPGSAHMQKIAQLLTDSGGRAAGFTHAPDYKFSAANSYWTSWKRGALKAELIADKAAIQGKPISGTARVMMKHVGRIMTTVAQPLFEKYIPNLKNGAFYEHMTSWLQMNPAATPPQQLAEARKIWDSMDNRFGEMVQDNIFWNKLFKQSAMLSMRSYSWNMGTVREIGGGAVDLAKTAKGGDFTTRAAYAIALPLYVAMMNAVYQYMKTGKAPESVDDLMAGQTGGEAPGVRVPALPRGRGMPNVPSGRQATVPERAMIPGYQKDVFGWYEDWQQELKNKVATAPRMAGELATNKDWKNDPIFNPEASAPEWLKEFFQYVGSNLGPISIRQLLRGEKTGSNITTPEMAGGIRPAPGYLQDPEGYAEAKRRRNVAGQSRKQFLEKRQQRQYGGSEE